MNSRDLFNSIGGIDEDIIARAERKENKKMKNKMKIIVPIAACMAVIIAAAGVLGGAFAGKTYKVSLDSGEEYVFRKTSVSSPSTDINLPLKSRELTADEFAFVFPYAKDAEYGLCYFDDETGKPVRFEGKAGGIRIILAKEDTPLTDTVTDNNPSVTEIGGTPVSIGYFITQPNSRGVRNAVFCGTFKCGEYGVYVEGAGSETLADEISAAVAEFISNVIENGTADFSALKE